jgi:hypothetical protein
MINNAQRLYKNNMNKSKVDNYKLKLTYQDTKLWTELISKLDHESYDYKMLINLLEEKKSIIVKIGNYDKLQKEYTIANLNIPNFINFYCYLKFHAEKSIIAMPFYELGPIDKYNWTKLNFDIFKNVIKHIICSLLYAYEKYGFIHNDIHVGNILLTKSSKKSISYSNNIEIPVIGILPTIMDFNLSKITSTPNDVNGNSHVYIDIIRILLLLSSECNIIVSINTNIINKYVIENTPISKDIYESLLHIIDNIKIIFIKSDYIKS